MPFYIFVTKRDAMRGRILICLVFFLMKDIGLGAQVSRDPLFDALKERGEIYVVMNTGKLKAAAYLPPGVSIDRIKGDSVFLYFHPADSTYIRAHLSDLTLLVPPSEKTIPHMAAGPDEVLNGTAYPTWNQYLEIMEYFADTWPEICTIDTIGVTPRGRLILAAVLNGGHYQRGTVPEVFYTSSIHGDEVTGYSLMLRLINYLLTGNTLPDIEDIYRDKIIVINPLSNPDGTYYESDTTIFGAIRANSNLADLNRNYPDPKNGDHPDGRNWQPENIAMMDYMGTNPPALSANFHGGAEVFNYPFDTWVDRHADDEWFMFIGHEYADTASKTQSSYMNDLNNGITDGFDWYEVHGGRQDYVTWFLFGREVTIELSEEKMPPANQLNSFWDLNRASMLNLIRQSNYGLYGHVTDAVNGKGVEATISIPEHDRLHSEIQCRKDGSFTRFLISGTYSLTISADGYVTLETDPTTIENYLRTEINVALDPLATESEYSAKTDPNPFYDEFSLIIHSLDEDYVYTSIYSMQGILLDERFFLMERGRNEFSISPHIGSPGMYVLVLRSEHFNSRLKIIKGK